MNYSYEKTEKSSVKINIELNKDEWIEAQNKAYEKTKNKYSLEGFRKGHVPKSVLISVYGQGVFYEDAINIAFPDYYEEILGKEESIHAIDMPSIDIGRLDDDGIELIATVEVMPEVKLGAYTGLTVEKKDFLVSEEEVDAELNRLVDRNSRLVEVKDRAAAGGDTVTIDYSGSVDGEKFEGGTAENQQLELGSNTFIPGFEDQVVGMNIGEERDINVKFPDDYHAENLKGKDAVFHVVLHEIRVKELPEINDEFIKDAAGFDTVEDYKNDKREQLKKDAEKNKERYIEDSLLKQIDDASEVEIPDCLVERQIDNMVHDFEYRLMYQGLKLEDYLKYVKMDMDKLRDSYKESAKSAVKSQLVIEEIIKKENIDASDEDVEKKIAENAEEMKKTVEEYKEKINEKQMDYFKNSIVVDKLFAFLKENNNI